MNNSFAEQVKKNAAQEGGKFVNEAPVHTENMFRILKQFIVQDRTAPMPTQPVPVTPLTAQALQEAPSPSLYRLGHSTILIKVDGQYVLTDPVFSKRASPVQWMGPKRFHDAPLTIDELPPIDVVLISHDHYDHLDKASVRELNGKVKQFVVPLKVGKRLQKFGVAKEKITELDWWQSHEVNGLKLVATPAQHFSGRGLFDRDKTLWCSWSIIGKESRIFFSGDGGYFAGFKEIGDAYGPFDITLIETGAYNKMWGDTHMMPEESVQAHLDVKGVAMVPIHNGTFDLALHDWYEPFERALNKANEKRVNMLSPVFGERVDILNPTNTQRWWQSMMTDVADETKVTEKAEKLALKSATL
ncbi:MBL fold metallo-hydrolase [Marinibactrum halimedae]|nr:MBL fold metallo-hydrolase [Marinibactrum halimedae]MCD9458733.1 MBL fold metallo-hydrolase [Marinibactrum halimedae]